MSYAQFTVPNCCIGHYNGLSECQHTVCQNAAIILPNQESSLLNFPDQTNEAAKNIFHTNTMHRKASTDSRKISTYLEKNKAVDHEMDL